MMCANLARTRLIPFDAPLIGMRMTRENHRKLIASCRLWREGTYTDWCNMLDLYRQHMESFGFRTASLDAWFHSQLPEILASRCPPYITKQEATR